MDSLKKYCPICKVDLPIDAFGFSQTSPDGRGYYCKSCVNNIRRAERQKEKELRAEQQKLIGPPSKRVLDAIDQGARTQREIGRETGLSEDDLGDVIAELLLWSKAIRTQVIDGKRMYFKNGPDKPKAGYQPAASWIDLSMQAVKGERQRVA